RERLVRLLADRAVGHGAGLEAPDDTVDRLDFLQGYRLRRRELQQSPQGRERLRLIVDQLRVRLVRGIAARAHRLLQAMDRLRVEEVMLAVDPPLVHAASPERVAIALAGREGL